MREKKLGNSRVSEKQDNGTADAREEKLLGHSGVSVCEKKKIRVQQGIRGEKSPTRLKAGGYHVNATTRSMRQKSK